MSIKIEPSDLANFPTDAESMTTAQVKDGTKMLAANQEESNKMAYVTVKQIADRAAASVSLTGIELEPLVGGTTSGTALVVPNGPAGEQRTAEVASGLWYNFGSGATQTDANKRWKAYWNGSSWSLNDMGSLPTTNLDGNVAIGDTRGLKGDTVAKQAITKEVELIKNPTFDFIDPLHSNDLNTIIADVKVEAVADSVNNYLPNGRLKKWRIQTINAATFTITIGYEDTDSSWIGSNSVVLNASTLTGVISISNLNFTITLKQWSNYSAIGYLYGYSPNIIKTQSIIDALSNLKTYNQVKLSAPLYTDAIISESSIFTGKSTFSNGKVIDDEIVLASRNKGTSVFNYKTIGVFNDLFAFPTRIGKGNYTYGGSPAFIEREYAIAKAISNINVINADKDATYKISWVNVSSGFYLQFYVSKIKGSSVVNFNLGGQYLESELTGVKTLSATIGVETVELVVNLDAIKLADTYYLSPDNISNNRLFNEGSLIISKANYTVTGAKDIVNDLKTGNKLNAIVGSYGSDNTIYNFVNNSVNGKFRIKFSVRFNENMTLSNARRDILCFRNGVKDLSIVGYSSNVVRNSAYQQSNSSGTNIQNQVVESLSGVGYHNATNGFVLTTRNALHRQLFGKDALWIRYKYDADGANNLLDVCAEITSTALRIYRSGDNTTLTELLFETYPNTISLANAIKAIPYLDAGWHFNAPATSLLKFTAMKLVTEYWAGSSPSDRQAFNDAGRLHLPLSIDESWHTVEVVSDGTAIYVVWDGIIQKVQNVIPSDLTNCNIYLGGNATTVLVQNSLRDLEINFDNTGDAEVFEATLNQQANTPIIVSNMHPHIKVYMAHEIQDVIDSETTTTLSTTVSADRLAQVFEKLNLKGYTFITVDDVADYLHGKKELPKRCATIVYDDYRYENWLNQKFRNLLNKNGIKASWAWITDWTNPITDDNGNTVSQQFFIDNVKEGGMTIHSHTRDHRYIYRGMQSTLDEEFYLDIMSSVNHGISSNIMTYPYGGINPNVIKSSEHNFKIGFQIPVNGKVLAKGYSPAYTLRERIEWYQSLSDVLACIV